MRRPGSRACRAGSDVFHAGFYGKSPPEQTCGGIRRELGRAALRNAHIHISGSHYDEAGELKHLDLMQSDFHFDDWIEALADFDVRGLVICESPNREEDALMLKALYLAQKAKAHDPTKRSEP